MNDNPDGDSAVVEGGGGGGGSSADADKEINKAF
jgi:hypothetical protein